MTSNRQSGNFDLSRMLSTGAAMNSSIIEKLQPSYQGKDPELFKSGSNLSQHHLMGPDTEEAKSLDDISDPYLHQEDEDFINRTMIENNHDLIDDKLMKYLYQIEDGTLPTTDTLENLTGSTRQLFEMIKT